MFRDTFNEKYFRLLAVASFGILMIPSSSSSPAAVPKECVEVAIYAQKMAIESMTFDLRFAWNFIACVKEMHRLYQTTNWKEVHNMIPSAVREVLHNLPNMGKKALAVATTRTQGLFLLPLYSLYKVVNMFHEAMTLDMEYSMHREEFERLQIELELTIDQIHNEFLPNWEDSSTTALQKTSTDVLEKLDRFSVDLKRLARSIKSDIDRSYSNKDLAVTSLVGSAFVFVASLVTGCAPVAALSGTTVLTSLASEAALDRAIRRLESLQHEVESTCSEIKEYRRLAHEIISQRRRAPRSDPSVVILFSVIVISLCLLYLVGLRETREDRPTGQTGTGRVGTRQRDKRAPRVRSAREGIPRFRMVRVLKKIKYKHWQKKTVNRETVFPVESKQEENNNDKQFPLNHVNTRDSI